MTGTTAINIDTSTELASALPVFIVFIVGLALILLLLVFRSILVPITAVVGFLFTIAAQIGALFTLNWARSPLHRLKVRHVFGPGFSQDGGFTFAQADVYNAIDRLPNGGPVYDGYVPGGTVGPSDINFGLTAAGSLPSGVPRNRMQPRDSPVIQINTETERFSSAV